MKLIHKLLLGYFLVTVILGVFSTLILTYNIDRFTDNLSVYREREVKSFVSVIDASINDKKSLKTQINQIQEMFDTVSKKLPHIKRITLHAKNDETNKYTHIASSVTDIIGTPSHPEDIEAIQNNKSTILYESTKNENFIDITHPIIDKDGVPIAALGVAISLSESDVVLQKAIFKMKKDAISTVFLALIFATVVALIVSLFTAKKILLPINKLKDAAESITKQKQYSSIDIDSSDEIGQLAVAFNSMTYDLRNLHLSMEDQITLKTNELEEQYLTDNLTKLPNRQALLIDFKKFEDLKNFGLAILDISSFKDINDVYGVEIGNQVLIELSRRYISYIYQTDLKIYRISGDEIAIVNPDSMPQQKFIAQIGTIIKNIEHEKFFFEDSDIEVSLSIHAGISYEYSLCLEKANIALIKAKQHHKDYTLFDQKDFVENKQENNIKIISKIKSAINDFGFKAYYQPIIDHNNNIVKYEALVRMEDGDEVISPFFFLDIAKKSKYYQDITKIMIFQAFHEFENIDKMISINICADDLLNQETQTFIIHQLKHFKQPNKVVFELVESEDLHKIATLKEFISSIKSLGAKIAIDDFGTGYSNFSYLLDLEPDYLKIDGSLIKNIDVDKKSYIIVQTIVSFAHSLDITVIAEFVHSQSVLEVCKELQIDEFQGYLFGEPSKSVEI